MFGSVTETAAFSPPLVEQPTMKSRENRMDNLTSFDIHRDDNTTCYFKVADSACLKENIIT